MMKIKKIFGSMEIDLDTGEIIDDSLIDCFGGGKGGGYSGPSATEIEMQKMMYRNQWEAEQEAEKAKEVEAVQTKAEEEAKAELEERRGVKDVLSNSQIGFKKKDKADKTIVDDAEIGFTGGL